MECKSKYPAPLLAESHIYFSEGQHPWDRITAPPFVRSTNVVTGETVVSNETGKGSLVKTQLETAALR
jgi:hypothetical protein